MTTFKRTALLLALGACLAAAGCGSDDNKGAPIPSEQAQSLEGRLADTENRLADGSVGACDDILQDTMPEVGNILETLPDSVDPDVRDALEQSFDNLWNLVESECQDLKPDEPAQTTPTETTPTETTPTETTPTETTPTETTPTSPDEAPLPPEGNGNNGGAVPPEGGGNGGGFGPGAAKAKKEKR